MPGGTESIVLGDLNGDGKLDVVTAEFDSKAVSARLGNGAGGFGALTTVALGGAATDVALGDVNGDGKLDAVAAVNGGNRVVLLVGNGTGGFAPAVTVGTGSAPDRVVLADLDGNGTLDLAWSNFSGASVAIASGTGTGSFTGAHTVAVPPQPIDVAVGNFDGVGALDLAVTGGDDDVVTILSGNGALGFAAGPPQPVGKRPSGLAAGDLDGDGVLDLAVNCSNSNAVALLLSASPGAPVPIDPGPGFVTDYPLRDLNGDLADDLLVANLDTVRIALADGAGGFLPFTDLVVGPMPVGIEVGDLNGDARPDLAVTSGDAVWVAPGDGAGHFGAATAFPTEVAPGNVRLADLDADGDLDVVTQNGITADVGHFNGLLNDGSGALGPFVVSLSLRKATLLVADMDGDGLPDAIATSEDSNAFAIAPGNGAGAFGPLQIHLVSGPHGSDLGDFDADGRPDLAVALEISAEVRVFRNLGGGALATILVPLPGAGPNDVVTLDADGDGWLDLATPNGETNSVSVAFGDGAFHFAPVQNFLAEAQPVSIPRRLERGDIDADGAPELIVRDQFETTLWLLANLHPSPFLDLGDAQPGMTGLPVLTLSGDLAPGAPSLLALSGAAPNAAGGLFVSTADTPVPFVGGVLHAFPIALFLPLATNGIGHLGVAFAWPAGLASGTVIVLQAAIADPVASNGVALSNALKISPP